MFVGDPTMGGYLEWLNGLGYEFWYGEVAGYLLDDNKLNILYGILMFFKFIVLIFLVIAYQGTFEKKKHDLVAHLYHALP